METRSLAVLLIANDAEEVAFVSGWLGKLAPAFAIDLTTEDRLSSGLRTLGAKPFDLVLMDLMLPDSDGFTSVMQFREKATEVPLVVITADEELAKPAMELGAQDFIIKGKIDAASLKRAIGHALLWKPGA